MRAKKKDDVQAGITIFGCVMVRHNAKLMIQYEKK